MAVTDQGSERDRRIIDLVVKKVCDRLQTNKDDLSPNAKKAVALITMDNFNLGPSGIARQVYPGIKNYGVLYGQRTAAKKLMAEEDSFKKILAEITSEVQKEVGQEDTGVSSEKKTGSLVASPPLVKSNITPQEIAIYLLVTTGVAAEIITKEFGVSELDVWQASGKVMINLGLEGSKLSMAFQSALHAK